MKTAEMVMLADKTRKTYSSGSGDCMRYQKEKGFHREGGSAWPARAFCDVNDIFAIDQWKELEPLKVTMDDIKVKFGREIEIVG